MSWDIHEAINGWHFRGRYCKSPDPSGRFSATAECRRGPFQTDSALTEPAGEDVWFEFAATPEEAVRKLKAEVWS